MSQSMDNLEQELFAAADCTPFIPTNEWQPILPGQSVPPGLWMRMDISTGIRSGRLMPSDGEAARDSSAVTTIGVRDDNFDETIPNEEASTNETTFFDVYSCVFDRNAKFSYHRPVPILGSLLTSDSEVNIFYQFWTNFLSCREFAPDESISFSRIPSEKQRESEKKYQFTMRQKDTMRVRRLATSAREKDPRILRMRREMEATANALAAQKLADHSAREAARLAEIAVIRSAEIEAAAIREAKIAAEIERATSLKLAEEVQKQQHRELRKKLRAAFGKVCKVAGLDEIHTDYIRAALTPEQLQPMLNAFALDPQSVEGKTIFNMHLNELLAAESARAEEAKRAAAAAKAQRETTVGVNSKDKNPPWSVDELAMLTKAVGMYPAGVPLRWHKMSDLLASNFSTVRDIGDVMKRARAIEDAAAAAAGGVQANYSNKTVSPSPVLQESPSSPTDATTTSILSSALASSSSLLSPSHVSPSATAVEAVVSPSSSSTPSPISPITASAFSSVPFTLSEQALFEYGLANISRDDPKRWSKIAEIVGNKTIAECRARYQFIRAIIKAEKLQTQRTTK